MTVSVERIWELLQQSGLVDGRRLESLRQEFASAKLPKAEEPATLVRWLVTQNAITAYHGKVLLAGQPGPFFYGDYLVTKRIEWPVPVPLFGALHLPTKHRVTLLFLDHQQAPTPEQLNQLAQVTRWAAGVVSPHLLRCYELVTAGVYRFFVLERIRGGALTESLSQKPLAVDRACSIAKDVALGLAHIHQAGQVHGEIRPQNVLLRPEGDTQLVYFPLWRSDPLGPPTGPNSPEDRLRLAADYLAPEMITGQGVGPASDLYSLGCLLYHLLAGEAPFGSLNSTAEKVQAHLQSFPTPIRDKRPEVPEELAAVVHTLLNKHPQQRYPSALHVVEALGPFESTARPQPSPPPATAVAFEQHLMQRVVAVADPQAQAVPGTNVPARPAATAVPSGAPVSASGAAEVAPAAAIPGGSPAPAAPAAAQSESALPPGLDFGQEEKSASSVVQPRRRQRSRSEKLVMLAGTAVGSVLVILLALMVLMSGGSSSSDDGADPGKQTARQNGNQNSTTKQQSGSSGKSQPAESNSGSSTRGMENAAPVLTTLTGEPMWASPTAGPPLDVRYLPNGVQMVVSLRPRELLNHTQGKVLLETLGSGTEYALNSLAQTSGVPLEQMELAVLGFLPGGSGKLPRVTMVIHTTEPLDAAALRSRLSGAETARVGTRDVIVAGSWGYYLAGPKQLVVAPVEPLEELQEEESPLQSALANALEPPPLRREMEQMLPWTDSRRTFNVLVAPSFLFAGGKELWQGAAGLLRKPAQLFLGEKLQALLLSMHLAPDYVFFEARLAATADVAPAALAKQFHEKLASLPSVVEDQIAQINVSPYSRRILFRFPRMLEQVVNHTDWGVHRRQAVLRCYLPPQAAPNLAFATYLLAVEKQGGGSGGVTVAAQTSPQQQEPKTLAEVLQKKIISLSFPRDTLEQSLMMFGQEIGYPVRILGADLQLEGITKNQSFGLDLKDKPAGEILRTILKKANPDGKLIYVIRKEGDQEVLVITTRKAAQERGDPIPPELQQKSS